MGKCISKQATTASTSTSTSASTSLLAIEHSVKDLPAGKQNFCTKYAASADHYVAITADDEQDAADGKGEPNNNQENQLCVQHESNNKHANNSNIADRERKCDGHTEHDQEHGQRRQCARLQHKQRPAKNNTNKQQEQEQEQQEQWQRQSQQDGLGVQRKHSDTGAATMLLSKNQLEICKLATTTTTRTRRRAAASVEAPTTARQSTEMVNSSQHAIDQTSDDKPPASNVIPAIKQPQPQHALVPPSAALVAGNADLLDNTASAGYKLAAHSLPAKLGNINNNDTNDERHCLAHLDNLFAQQQQWQVDSNSPSPATAALAMPVTQSNNNQNQSQNMLQEAECLTTTTAACVGRDKAECVATTPTPAHLQTHKATQAQDKLTNKLIPNKVTAKYRQAASIAQSCSHASQLAQRHAECYAGGVGRSNGRELICPNSMHCEQIAGNLLCQHSEDIIFLHILTAALGQAESKKSGKKYCANSTMDNKQTKGTAMFFGFRKKLNSTPKKFKKLLEGNHDFLKHKKQDKCNNPTESSAQSNDDENCEIIRTVICNDMLRDDNGNAAETLSTIHFEKMGAAAIAAAAATASAIAATNTQTTNAKSTTTMATTKSALKTTTTTAAAATNGNQGAAIGNDYLPGANNRFGYRGHSIPRPASTGIIARQQHHHHQQQQQQHNDARDNIDNNNCNSTSTAEGQQPKGSLVSNLKRRSKSANTGRTLTANAEDAVVPTKPTQAKTLTFNLNQNTTIEYQRRQFFEQPITTTATADAAYGRFMQPAHTVNTGMHTNVIVRPTARTAQTAYSKFTLQTVSLPKPEFPVAISLTATTPTTPSSTFSPTKSPHLGNAAACVGGARAKEVTNTTAAVRHGRAHEHPLTFCATQAPLYDQKSVKQMTNNSTRRGFSGSREISADSGIASMDMPLDSNSSTSSGGMSKRQHASPKRSRSRPRHLQMVMNGRHKFEVRELDDPLSSESSSFVEPLSLPKLPAENQTMPLPLCGLVRSNTVLSRESYERKHNDTGNTAVELPHDNRNNALERNASEESESIDEEKLYLDNSTSEKSAKRQFRDINTCSSKTSSPGSSIMSSWCNAGESLAVKDCSSLSLTSSEGSNKHAAQQQQQHSAQAQQTAELDDDNSLINTDMQISTISSITETQTAPQPLNEKHAFTDNKLQEQHADVLHINEDDVDNVQNNDRPKCFVNALNEAKFAEIALAASKYLLDDETSPTDSLVSSTESDDAGGGCDKLKKHKFNEELQEKDIDEISPELEMGSPISPGTPTHASRSLSFSECGNLIDDEIADQPALLFNNESNQDVGEGGHASGSTESRKEKTDTPTLMETASLRSLKSQSKARTALQQAIELSLRTPISIRKAVMDRAESLDTLSPCESICSDDLMMDFDTNSSMDSIDRSASIKSRSGSDLNNMDETTLFSEMERRGSDVMKELNSLLKVRLDRKSEKDSVIAHLPARATRLLNRSRLQQQCPLNNADSDSSKSAHSVRQRSVTGSRTSIRSNSAHAHGATATQQFHSQHHNFHTHKQQQTQQYQRSHHQPQHHHHHQQRLQKRDTHSSSDDLMLYDKSFRNAMIQDVLQFKKQLLRLRRILQEDENHLKRTETLNPFENDNGQLFASCGLDSKQLDDLDLASLTSSTTDDPMQELADLRRQVVYLQGQVDDRDRTIRLQRNLIEKLEAEKSLAPRPNHEAPKECITIATQTERSRPPAIGAEGLSRSKPEFTSYTTYFPALCCNDATTILRNQQQYSGNGMKAMNQTRRHTVISATLTNYSHNALNHPHTHNHHNHHQQPQHHHSTNTLNNQLTAPASSATANAAHTNGHLARRASIAWETQAAANYPQTTTFTQQQQYKPVRITLIGEPMQLENGIATRNTNTATSASAATTTTTTLSNNHLNVNDNNATSRTKTNSLSNLNLKKNNEHLHSDRNGNNHVYSNNNGNDNSYSSNNNAKHSICKNDSLNLSSVDDLLANHIYKNNNNNNNYINSNGNMHNNNNNLQYKAQNGYTKLQTTSSNANYHNDEQQPQQQQYHPYNCTTNNNNNRNNGKHFPTDKLNPTVTIV